MKSEKEIRDEIDRLAKQDTNDLFMGKFEFSQNPKAIAIETLAKVLEGEPRYSLCEFEMVLDSNKYDSIYTYDGAKFLIDFMRENPKKVKEILNE